MKSQKIKEIDNITPASKTGVILTYFSQGIVRLDWLSLTFGGALNLNTKIDQKRTINMKRKKGFFQLIHTGNSTRNFNDISELYIFNTHFADIQYNCRLPELRDICIIKLKNEILYLYAPEELTLLLNKMMYLYELNFKSINRIDLCKDFQIFDNGKEPAKFIHDFLQNKLLLKGKRNFSVYGKAGKTGIKRLETLKFGTYSSDVYLKLYNKTAEQKINFKQHIFETWEKQLFGFEKPIFRLEFTIQGNFALNYKITDNFDFSKNLNFGFLLKPEILTQIFYSLINKYFVFYRNIAGKSLTIKSRLPLYKFINPLEILEYNYIKSDSAGATGKSEKAFTNKLKKLLYEDFYKGEIEKKVVDVLQYTEQKFNYTNISKLQPSKKFNYEQNQR